MRELKRIAEDCQQMNMALPARIASEINYQQYIERLEKTAGNTPLNIRDLVEKQLQGTISGQIELTGKFREESDYENIIKYIEFKNVSASYE
jgi:hypothetical protein